ncbi:MAG: hypothetical protein OEY59_13580 [Deltaproteobacteria bacterium]|nr:hypothetical protein [Deltaproteobacteria bacterium]
MAYDERKQGYVYFRSYKRTKEIPYLKLSARHAQKAIEIYYQLQTVVSRKTKFFRKLQLERIKTCDFHQQVRIVSSSLDPEHYIKNIKQDHCEE